MLSVWDPRSSTTSASSVLAVTSFPPGPAAFLTRRCSKGGKFALSEVFVEQDSLNETFLSSNTPNPASSSGLAHPRPAPSASKPKTQQKQPTGRGALPVAGSKKLWLPAACSSQQPQHTLSNNSPLPPLALQFACSNPGKPGGDVNKGDSLLTN